MTLGYYLGHALELAAVAMIAIPAARDIARTGASFPLVGDLTATDLVASEEAYLGPRVRALMVRLAERDGSTEEHTRRVAILAAQVGEELKLPATTRRHLAVGGLLHDIGKLSVPLEILRKPAGLTDEEYAEIKRHPEAGRRLLEELGGFSPTVRDLVSDHHERLDGRGYPRGLTEEELPLHTRILTVCDVYDALVSDRVYRAAWTPERAFELLRDDTGSAFDERCVEALARVVGLAAAGRPGLGRRRRRLAAARPGPPGLAAHRPASRGRCAAARRSPRRSRSRASPACPPGERDSKSTVQPPSSRWPPASRSRSASTTAGSSSARDGAPGSGERSSGRSFSSSAPPWTGTWPSARDHAAERAQQLGRLGAAGRGRRRGTGCRTRARSRPGPARARRWRRACTRSRAPARGAPRRRGRARRPSTPARRRRW